ncbi:hypothetical protein LLH23_16605 [bacterium]|nr:hypothetical protein [bacterium]
MKPTATGRDQGRGPAAWLRRCWRSLSSRFVRMKAPGRFLCDSCRYDYGNACRRPGRPNVTDCPEYRAR